MGKDNVQQGQKKVKRKGNFNMAESDALLFHLTEAQGELVRAIGLLNGYRQKTLTDNEIDLIEDDQLPVIIAHAYHHLNTAWNARTIKGLDDEAFSRKGSYREFDRSPTDISQYMAHGSDGDT